MRLLKGPPTGPRLLGLHKPLTIFGLIILLLLYWHFALLLENLNYIPRFFEALINIFRFFDPLFNIPIFFLERIAPYFSLRVLRHLIPPVAGWFMARQAILVMLQSFYDLSNSKEAKSLLDRLQLTRLRLYKPIMITLQNFEELRQRETLLKIGGPGRIVVARDAALVTELNGRFHRVLGPGRHDLGRFEYPRTLVDLRPQERESDIIKMMTSDGIELTTSLTVTFQISGGDIQVTREKPFPYDEEAVRIAAYTETVLPDGSIGRWESLPLSITSGQLKGIVAEDRLDELIAPEVNGIDVHRRLQMEMERRAKNIMRSYGVTIRGTRLGALKLDPKIENQRIEYWKSHWETQKTLQKADGEVEILQSHEIAMAEAEAIMLQAIAEGLQRARRAGRDVPSREVVALRLIESLEAMARNSGQVLPLPDQLMPQLGSIREQLMLTSGASEEKTNQE